MLTPTEKNTRNTTGTRHGKRALGTVVISFPLPQGMKKAINRIARDDGHTASEWLRITLRDVVRRKVAVKKSVTVA